MENNKEYLKEWRAKNKDPMFAEENFSKGAKYKGIDYKKYRGSV